MLGQTHWRNNRKRCFWIGLAVEEVCGKFDGGGDAASWCIAWTGCASSSSIKWAVSGWTWISFAGLFWSRFGNGVDFRFSWLERMARHRLDG